MEEKGLENNEGKDVREGGVRGRESREGDGWIEVLLE